MAPLCLSACSQSVCSICLNYDRHFLLQIRNYLKIWGTSGSSGSCNKCYSTFIHTTADCVLPSSPWGNRVCVRVKLRREASVPHSPGPVSLQTAQSKMVFSCHGIHMTWGIPVIFRLFLTGLRFLMDLLAQYCMSVVEEWISRTSPECHLHRIALWWKQPWLTAVCF